MPELPEVEVVRRGIADWATGRVITAVDVHDERSLRRHEPRIPAGPESAVGTPPPLGEDFRTRLVGRLLETPQRRGKYLWIPLGPLPADEGPSTSQDAASTATARPAVPVAEEQPSALLVHLGMSGQVLVEDRDAPVEKHLKISLDLSPRAGAPEQLRFVDQRIFGGMQVSPLVPADHWSGAVPAPMVHIAPDPFEDLVSSEGPAAEGTAAERLFRAFRRRRSGLKRSLLDQTLISGIGNIYADEALWRARLHFARRTETITRAEAGRVLAAAREVMEEALAAGGTSFDALYVNVNGASGYFDRSLAAYGQEGRPCPRCAGTPRAGVIRRTAFMGRSSYWCPTCQPRPRRGRW
ncbi:MULTISPECIES: bifunctional DNA-formamidopyrimidine glycosylase/DNA-(apurinic or apyrimidinic site) lyase [Actinomycetes]|uniref:DNA-formamidopyrimidine glycosylase n=2 Tax=Actinomycetes TaxID=1760 RepID=A0ABP6LVB3_9MICC